MSIESNLKGQKEFITLMAFMMSFVALSIDAMLPALGQIVQSFSLQNPNDSQLVVSSIFLGMSLGLMIYGPFSDSYGRKKAIYIGVGIFSVGCLISYFSTSFDVLIISRVIQGFGAASARVITLAIIRDKYEGNKMAKIMSLIMVIFILVPALAPALGQLVLLIGTWRDIFAFMLIFSLSSLVWFAIRLEETLIVEKRLDFSLTVIFAGIKETLTNKTSVGYMLASSLIFGSFVGYLSSAQQIIQIQYNSGELFSLYFGILAISIGMSSFVNSRLVEKIGMVNLTFRALMAISIFAGIFLLYIFLVNDRPHFIIFMIYLMITFFCLGILFGNFNTLSIQPLGHIAGVANSVISSSQTLISVLIGGFIGHSYNGTIIPLVVGFFVCGLSSLLISYYVKNSNMKPINS